MQHGGHPSPPGGGPAAPRPTPPARHAPSARAPGPHLAHGRPWGGRPWGGDPEGKSRCGGRPAPLPAHSPPSGPAWRSGTRPDSAGRTASRPGRRRAIPAPPPARPAPPSVCRRCWPRRSRRSAGRSPASRGGWRGTTGGGGGYRAAFRGACRHWPRGLAYRGRCDPVSPTHHGSEVARERGFRRRSRLTPAGAARRPAGRGPDHRPPPQEAAGGDRVLDLLFHMPERLRCDRIDRPDRGAGRAPMSPCAALVVALAARPKLGRP